MESSAAGRAAPGTSKLAHCPALFIVDCFLEMHFFFIFSYSTPDYFFKIATGNGNAGSR